jgi:hypothetical protein
LLVNLVFYTKQPSNQATKQPSNQATKQPSNQATKQPSNQATKQPSTYIPHKSSFGIPSVKMKRDIVRDIGARNAGVHYFSISKIILANRSQYNSTPTHPTERH